jgi:hypothetical protein
MALKREIELKLEDAELTQFFIAHENDWLAMAQTMYDLVKELYPQGALIRPDDVAEYLLPALKVDDGLRTELASRHLRQNHWFVRFTDLVVDRCWARISGEEE